jgi:hypothetical protein
MQDQKTPMAVVKLAYELAVTGRFEDVAALERELIAEGYDDVIHILEGASVRAALDEVCAAGREREAPRWHHHAAW